MLNFLSDLFNTKCENGNSSSKNEHKLKIAACSLLLEIATADDNFAKVEKEKITEIMKDKFSLTDEEVQNLISISKEKIKKSVSVYEFTNILNKQLNQDEKYSIVKYLWEIAFADGNVDSYEEFYIKRISNNLHINNKDRVAAKLEVKENLKL